MAAKVGEVFAAEIKVLKTKRGEPTVVLIDGKRFIMEAGKR